MLLVFPNSEQYMCACHASVVPFFFLLPHCCRGSPLSQWMKRKTLNVFLVLVWTLAGLLQRFCRVSLIPYRQSCEPVRQLFFPMSILQYYAFFAASEPLKVVNRRRVARVSGHILELPRHTSLAQWLTFFFSSHMQLPRRNGSRQRSSEFPQHMLSYYSLSERICALSHVWSTLQFFL